MLIDVISPRLTPKSWSAAVGMATAVLILAAIILAVIFLWRERNLLYRVGEYHGEGVITDGGYWSHSRYHIALPEIVMTETQRRSYSLKGLPTADFTFGLQVMHVYVEGQKVPHEDFDAVRRNIPVAIAVKLTDDQMKTLVYAPPSPIQNWELSKSVVELRLWRVDARDIRLRRGQHYRLDVDVRAESVNGSRVVVRPILSGGGM